jgi:HlyD family secretion protein
VRKWIALFAAILALGVAAYGFLGRTKGGETTYRFVTVQRGDLESVVSATGTLSAVTTVQVGTQTSGLISKILVDFNDRVTKGQVIAQLDTTLLESAVREADATLDKNQAQLEQATRELARLGALHAAGVVADTDFNTAQYNLDIARAAVKSAEVGLDRARQNLAYATITAPVSGTVVERDVDVGQTVAASLSAPKLFLIANDLSEMRILASVDESDIGQIREGQVVRFTVKAYPERKFTGNVKQVRLQSTTEQNVVSYTVVIAVKNPDGQLLPGMTATVQFIVATAKDILRVPNAALRFRPTEAMMSQLRRGTAHNPGSGASPSASAARLPGEQTLLFYVDADGAVAALPVQTGISDGQYTGVAAPSLQAGMQVLAGVTATTRSSSKNPFQAERQGGPPGPPPPGGF